MVSEDKTQPRAPAATEPPASPPAASSGRTLAERYRLGRRIGVGGMGEVFLAENLRTGGQVAIKLIQASVGAAWPRAVQRFSLEARHTASLSHPNIVQVFDYGQDGDTLFHVMEYVDGASLRDTIREDGPMPWERAARITRQVLMALGEAHESDRRLIHRDIKPGNVLITQRFGQRDFVKVVDFGIAHALTGPFVPSQRLLGSPQTMAPEQWNNRPVTPATDLYALGCTLYAMLTGRPPFKGTLSELANKHLSYNPAPPSTYVADVPGDLERWLAWLLRKPPGERPGSAREALEALEAVIAGRPVTLPDASSGVGRRTSRRFEGRLIGREAELGRLDALLPSKRLITLHGPGGVGKSRLARDWSRRHQERFSEVLTVDLSEASTLQGMCILVARALDVELRTVAPVEELARALAGLGEALLVLDNMEHLVQLAPQALTPWLEAAPEVRVLTTSRQSLGLGAEQLLEVTPLALPDRGAADPPSGASSAAVELFVERARQVRPNFQLTRANVDTIHRIVIELDGMPLALELAAAQIGQLQLETIIKRLDRRFELLQTSSADTSPRQAALKATLDWSWELLSDAERSALVQCSVFRESFSLEAAEAIIDLGMFPNAPWVMDVLTALVDKSLLVGRPTHSGDVRYSMYISIRDYAHLQRDADEVPVTLGLSGARALGALRRRHSAFFALYGRAAFLDGLDRGGVALQQLKEELANLNAALGHARARGPWHLAAHCALALAAYFERRGPFNEGRERVQRVLNAIAPQEPRLLARLHLAAGRLAQASGDLDAAISSYLASQPHARDAAAPHLEALSLERVASAQTQAGRLEDASRAAEAANQIAQQHGDHLVQSLTLYNLGNIHWLRGQFNDAAQLFRTCLAQAIACGDRRLQGRTSYALANLLKHQGHLSEAARTFRACLESARSLQAQRLQGAALLGLESIHISQGRPRPAIQGLQRCLHVARHSGDVWLQECALYVTGTAYNIVGDWSRALTSFDRAITLLDDVSRDPMLRCSVLLERGVALGGKGLLTQAADTLEEAAEAAEAIENHLQATNARLALARLMIRHSNLDAARDLLADLHPAAQSLSDTPLHANLHLTHATLALRSKDPTLARTHLTEGDQHIDRAVHPDALVNVRWAILDAWTVALEGDPDQARNLLHQAHERILTAELLPESSLHQLLEAARWILRRPKR